MEYNIALIPTPQSLTITDDGATMLPFADRIVENVDNDPSCTLATQLAHDIRQATGISWDIAKGQRWQGFIEITQDDTLDPATYQLIIGSDEIGNGEIGNGERKNNVNNPANTDNSAKTTNRANTKTNTTALSNNAAPITIRGGGFEGVRNGVQTLRQIIRQRGSVLPHLIINDAPAYPVRSYYLDVTRGRVPTLDWLKQWADKLCLYKYNELQLYVEHTFAFDGMSETWRAANPLSPADIIAFDAYCAQLGIELVPSVSTFGHLYTALRTHELRHLGEFPEDADRPFSFIERLDHHTLNITEPEAFALSTKMVDDYLELFTSRKFNICADETFDLGKGRSKQEADRRGVADMYADYVVRLCDHLSAQERKPQFWGDIAVSMPEILQRLPKNVTLLNWLYSPTINDEKVRLVAESGAQQIVCSAVWSWSSFMPYMHKSWNNISRLARFGLAHGAKGYMVTDWGDCGHVNDPRMSVPGMIYGAQCAWAPQATSNAIASEAAKVTSHAAPQVTPTAIPDVASSPAPDVAGMNAINRLISIAEYGDATGHAASLLEQASHCSAFSWLDTVEFLELDDGNGNLNRQVLGSVWTGKPETSQRIREADNLTEARRRMLEWAAPKLMQLNERDHRLHDLAMQLGVCIATAHGNAGAGLRPAIVMIEGQRLLNRFAWHMAVRAGVIEAPADMSKYVGLNLARALEIWGEHYASLWRQVSRESELDRIRQDLWRMADMLRAH